MPVSYPGQLCANPTHYMSALDPKSRWLVNDSAVVLGPLLFSQVEGRLPPGTQDFQTTRHQFFPLFPRLDSFSFPPCQGGERTSSWLIPGEGFLGGGSVVL